jgi:DNA uptake protein ComE-like DNA-binding protein
MSPGIVPRRRALTLIAVLLVMGGALVVATSLLFVAQSHLAGLKGAADAVQSRALAWSGVQAVIVRLDDQRSDILEGRAPRLDEQLTIYQAPGRLGVARLLPLGPGGERLVPEAGKLDLESADATALAATGLVDEALAKAIIDRRTALGPPWQSVAELLDVPELTAEMLWGTAEQIAAGMVVTSDENDIYRPGSNPGPRGLADVVTVFSFEPAVQRSGKLRINLNVPWSQVLAQRVVERFGQEASDTLRRVVEGGTTFESEGKIFQVLNFFQVPPEDWPDIVDAFTTEPGEFHFGRLDINTAPYEALLALPDLGAERAAQIVQVREELSDDQRATIAWPAIRGIIKPQEYEKLAGRITTRSWTYRLRLAGGVVDADVPDGPMRGAVIWEVVVDLCSPRARIAYLRDVTWLAPAVMIAASGVATDAGAGVEEEDEQRDRAEVSTADERGPESGEPADITAAGASPSVPSSATAMNRPGGPPAAVGPGQPEAGPKVSPGGATPAPAKSAPADTAPGAPIARRRIGRWTAG